LALLLAPSLAAAQSGVQWTRDRDSTLVSKDVEAERWAITYRLSDGRVTGNVFRTDGGPPAFLDCDRTAVTDTDATFDCWGADACAGTPCPSSQYTQIASGLSLPLSFFFPPGEGPGDGGGTVEDLIGTWRFTVDTGDDPDVLTYRFDQLENDGQVAVGNAEGSDNDIVASLSDNEFVMFERDDLNCQKYTFRFVGLDRLEGTQSTTVRVPFTNDCDTFTVGDRHSFFAERIG
jgi:hypothetical protein